MQKWVRGPNLNHRAGSVSRSVGIHTSKLLLLSNTNIEHIRFTVVGPHTLLELFGHQLSISQQLKHFPQQDTSILQHGHSGCSSSPLPGLNKDLFGSCQRHTYNRDLYLVLRQDPSHGLASWQTGSLGPCPARHHFNRPDEPRHVPQPRHT